MRQSLVKFGVAPEGKNIFNLTEAAAYTGYSESYLYKKTANNEIPHHNPSGKKLIFSRQKLDAWLLGDDNLKWSHIEKKASTHVSMNPL